MKIKKGDKVYPFITGDDVIITKGINHPGKTVDDAFEEVDNTLDEHKRRIDRLDSNMKHLYSYGGVGGNGSGGQGGTTPTGSASLFVSLGGHQLQNGGNAIVLNEPGTYVVEGNVSNSGGEVFYVTVGYGNKIDYPDTFKLSTELNRCRFSSGLNLKNNGEIVITFYDSEYSTLSVIRQNYIVKPHTFDVKFMYEFDNGSGIIQENEFNPYEYFIGDSTYQNPFIDSTFKIDIPNVTNVSLTYSIGDTTDGQGVESFGTVTDISNNHFKIHLNELHRNGKVFTDESNTGTYTVNVKLKYYVNAELVETEESFKITLIPSYLYINVRNPQNLIYDTLEELLAAIDNGVDGIPERYVNAGSYTSFYCKIYEGPIKTAKKKYTLRFNSYDLVDDDSDPGTPDVFVLNEDMKQSLDGVDEQVETPRPITAAFETPGIKQIEFSTLGQKTTDHSDERPVVKYIYVKEASSEVSWFPQDIEHNDFYFRANLGAGTYSAGFPRLSSGTSPLEISESDRPVTLSDEQWSNPSQGFDTTILSFGMQYSVVNNDGAKILETYESDGGYSQVPDIVLYADKLFSDNNKKICIPKESNFDKSVNEQYHLVQIVRYRVGYNNLNKPQYASYLYIDGKLESNEPILRENQLHIGKIVLNNVNAIYNLIEIQYVNIKDPKFEVKYTLDSLIYQYYLGYKEIMHAGEVSESEIAILKNISEMKFDGENVIVQKSFVDTVAPHMPIPTMMMEYTGTDVETFINDLFKGYPNGDDSFHQKPISLYWCEGLKQGITTSLTEIHIPNITDRETNIEYSGDWYVELQGTSTMRNRIKNFSLVLNTRNTTGDKVILMSPNYDANNPNSFLPERIWTIKADIADSAHANNTAVGKFVNHTCTPFSNGLTFPSNITPYIKNTLEGFPVLMYFKVGESVYYLGVYNFNMGRNSYYNLGYHTANDMVDMMNNITAGDASFSYSLGNGLVVDDLAIGEVQDNFAQFDFHQYDDSVLFQSNDSSITKMFGKDSKITGANIGAAKNTLKNFVKSVAIAGAYCFANIGKTPRRSKSDENDDCINRYNAVKVDSEDHQFIEYVPDIAWQFRYAGTNKIWEQKTDLTFDTIRGNMENLLQCISPTDLEGNARDDYHYLDFTSASEYYTICMAFGLVDSILKNMNIKSWNGKKCYVAFYDMDCALGENNAGGEDVSYLAATDFWHSNTSRGYVEPVDINYDYWDESVGKGFDFSSSYLFAIAKYAQAIISKSDSGLILNNYPQQFWAKLRLSDGELRNAKYFIDTYFSSGIGKVPAYLASLNYQVKYLYKGTILDDETGLPTEERFLANESAFNGTRIEKVKDWLNKRLHFLDVMFNVQGVGINIGGGYTIPMADSNTLSNLASNTDIVVLSDAFSTPNAKSALMSSNALPVDVYAPMNTPFIINRGSSNEIFLLCAGTDEPNPIRITATRSESYRFLGSKEFTNVSMVEPFLTSAAQIISNNIEEIKYGGRDVPSYDLDLKIFSTSVKSVKLDIPTFTGSLTIDNSNLNGQAIHTLNVSNSGLIGSWTSLKNLKSVNISSVVNANGTITVSNCPIIGDQCSISGTEDKPTTLQSLIMTGVSGNFNISNTKIQSIQFDAADGSDSSFEINGDTLLRTLNLSGFKKIKITGCPNIENLVISDINNVCEEIIINIPEYTNADGSAQRELKKFNSNRDGVFDFTSYTSLKTLGISGCNQAVVIKMPDHKVSIETFANNKNLEFIDTVGKNSCIELTKDSTFYNSPRYAMKQSWATIDDGDDNNKNITTLTGNYGYNQLKRTKMCIGESCVTLAHTFDKLDSGIISNYKSTRYTNEWGQKVNNSDIGVAECAWFINDVVGGQKLDDAWIDSSNIIHDTANTRVKIGEDRRGQIVSLAGCFYKQKGIIIITGADVTFPVLRQYTSLKDISFMYYGTSVTYLSPGLLDLPDSKNNNDDENALSWVEFIQSGEWKIAQDAFKHISYRISEFTSVSLTVYDPTDHRTILNSDDEFVDRLDARSILCPQTDPETGEYIPFTRIKTFNSFSINPVQWVDYTHFIEICPNVVSLIGFLSTDLSRAKMDGMLKTCTKLEIVSDSFNHTGIVEELDSIDLYDFFNWSDGTDYPLKNIRRLFDSTATSSVGFSIKKHISQEHFAEIIESLHNYKNITKLSNIFSYCTITNYNPDYEIKLEGDMNNIVSLSGLFYHCDTGNNQPLKIRRSFFEHLKNVTSVANTFGGVHFDHMLSYDFFCKRSNVVEDVFVKINDSYLPAKLYTTGYGQNVLNDMLCCFEGSVFENCKSWFDVNDGNVELIPADDRVVYNDTEYQTYYKKEGGKYIEYKVKRPDEYRDTLNNFTHYVDSIKIVATECIIDNHNIEADLNLYGTIQAAGRPFTTNDYNLYPTYCCLPPDIFYGCRNDCQLVNVFSNSNIIGVIPQHLLKNCYNSKLNNMFQNVNILPNLIYHYNKDFDNDPGYLEFISGIEIDNNSINVHKSEDDTTEYVLAEGNETVLFRNSDGELRKRKPIVDNEYSKSQYVYVPQGYTTNTNLKEAFTFRYNLPDQINLYESELQAKGITWVAGSYGTDYSPELRPELWPYYTQYFFTVDESIDWKRIYNMSSSFITDGQDIDYETGKVRLFSSSDRNYHNRWWEDFPAIPVDRSEWHIKTNGVFNVFLNLCGERDTRTGKLTDCGCLVSNAMNNYPQFDSFVSGSLVTFLNGRVFNDGMDGGRFTQINGSSIIRYPGFGRNIILPSIQYIPSGNISNAPKVLLSYVSDVSIFYDYMFIDSTSMNNYSSIFGLGRNITTVLKYKVI